ncbi:MAG: DUF6017 domain-containing protein [Clostridia bacterium]|nr:DUF6017 domain-containing protein [Clostridia bacterium]
MERETPNARKLEGVFAQGYGVVPKRVMLRTDLTPEAKALYAYYCVISGNNGGFQPAPKEELILKTVGMSHTRFIKHRKTLTDAGLILFSQARKSVAAGKQLFETSRFLIVKSPAANEDTPADQALSDWAAVQEGVFCDGFGLVPRSMFFDHGLSIEAKAAYTYLCVFANASTRGERAATPSAQLLADTLMSRKRVQHAMTELIRAGYIRRERMHNGAFAGFVYILNFEKQPLRPIEVQNDTAEHDMQQVDFDTAENADTKHAEAPVCLTFSKEETPPSPAITQVQNDTAETPADRILFETTEKETAQFETTQIDAPTLYSTTRKSTRKQIPLHNNISPVGPVRDGRTDGAGEVQMRFLRFCISEAAEQIEADVLKVEHGDIIDAITNLMGDIYATQNGAIHMNGRTYPVHVVAEVFRKLRARHIEHVLQSMRDYGQGNIRNIQAYLTACLYNAIVTCDAREYADALYR